MVNVVQISDTHLSRWDGPLRRNFRSLQSYINDVLKPDLIINTGDVILSSPDAVDDYVAASQLHADFEASVRYVPGNHDVGEPLDKDWYAVTSERIARFRRFFDTDWWVERREGWAFIGLNSQIIDSGIDEEREQWAWLESIAPSIRGERVFLFMHEAFWTLDSIGSDGRPGALSESSRERVLDLLSGTSFAGAASGHIHRYRRKRRGAALEVWAPSTGFLVEPIEAEKLPPGLEQLGIVQYAFGTDDVRANFLSIAGLEEVFTGSMEESSKIRPEIAAAKAAFDTSRTGAGLEA